MGAEAINPCWIRTWRRKLSPIETSAERGRRLAKVPTPACAAGGEQAWSAGDYIGGVSPSLPKFTRGACNVPSGFAVAAAMKILTPGLSSLLSPGT